MFTPIETSIGALLIHLAVSTLLLNNGDILNFTAILGRDMGIWKRLENIAILLGMAVSIIGAKAFIPTLAPSFVPNPTMTTTELLAAGVCVGWGTRNANGCTLEHVFCGIPVLSMRSIIATVLICTTTCVTVNFVAIDALHSREGPSLLTTYPSQNEIEALTIITTTAFLASLLLYYAFRTTSYIRIVVGFVSGLEFGLGLIVSGLATPGKVLALFCMRDRKKFDPSLALVLPFGVLPTLIRVWLRGFNKPPKFDATFHLPTLAVAGINWRFYLGTATLGLGWSWTGECLGPAILRTVLDPSWGWSWGGGFATGYLLLP